MTQKPTDQVTEKDSYLIDYEIASNTEHGDYKISLLKPFPTVCW